MDSKTAWRQFIAHARTVAERGIYREETPNEMLPAFQELCQTAFLRDLFGLPKPGESAPYLLYKDADYGFSVRAVAMNAGQRAPVHDHGHCWALYAGVKGTTEMEVFARLDDGSNPEVARLEVARVFRVGPGQAAAFPTHAIHRPTNVTDETSMIINVYSEDLADIDRHRYLPDEDRAIPYRGSGAAGADAQADLSAIGLAALG